MVNFNKILGSTCKRLAPMFYYWCLDLRTKIHLHQKNKSGSQIFLDCGAFDGCSSVKFLIANPLCDAVAFEPNKQLHSYYVGLPLMLIRRAVDTNRSFRAFYIDEIDGDGSSLEPSKLVRFGSDSNLGVPEVEVETIDLPGFINVCARFYDDIYLKLDVEGSEYEILRELVEGGAIKSVRKIFIEFHYQKMNIDKSVHDEIVRSVEEFVEVVDWDAADYAIHTEGPSALMHRKKIISEILGARGERSTLNPEFMLAIQHL